MSLRVSDVRPWLALLPILAAACDSEPTALAVPPAVEETSPTGQVAAISAIRRGTSRHVVVRREGSSADLSAAITAAGGTVARTHRGIGVYDVTNLSAQGLASLRANPAIEGVDGDAVVQWLPPLRERRIAQQVVQAQTNQSGAFFFPVYQWYLRQIKADQAWDASGSGEGTLVCVLDSGIDPGHLDLIGKVDLSRSASFVVEEDGIYDLDSHGTAVATLISSRGIGIASVAPDAQLCAIKVLNGEGSGSFADVIAGIMYAADVGADVINMSLGAYFSKKEEGARELVRAMQRAVNYASRRGVVVVASAGNDGINLNRDPHDFIVVPGELNNVISVGATAPLNQQDFGAIASYSNLGILGVDVFAPGGDYLPEQGGVVEDLMLSACSRFMTLFDCSSGADYLFAAGTSFASPLVAGQAAVIESTLPGNQTDEVIARCILRTAANPNGRRLDRRYAFGIVDVLASAGCRGGGHHIAAK